MAKKTKTSDSDTVGADDLIITDWGNEKSLLRAEMKRRASLIVSSVVGSFMSGDDPKHTTIRAVFNRLVVLLQIPVTFVIFERINGEYRGVVCFNKYQRDQNEIATAIGKREVSWDSRYDREPFQILGGNYFLVPIIIRRAKDGSIECSRLPRLKKGGDHGAHGNAFINYDLLAYALEEVLSVENYKGYAEEILKSLEHSIQVSQSQDSEAKNLKLDSPDSMSAARTKGDKNINEEAFGKILKSLSPVEDLKLHRDSLRKYFTDILCEVGAKVDEALFKNKDFTTFPVEQNGILDRVFKKTSKNLDFLRKLDKSYNIYRPEVGGFKPQSNYVVFLRNYSGPLCGAGSYEESQWDFHIDPYRRHIETDAVEKDREISYFDFVTRIAIGSRQEQDIRQYFSDLCCKYEDELLHEQMGRHIKPINRYFHQIGDENRVWHNLAKVLDNYFWDNIGSKTGIDEFIDVLKKPFGAQTRSAADLVFEHGVVHFSRPFATGGLKRCFPNEGHAKKCLEKIFGKKSVSEVSIIDLSKSIPYISNVVDDLKRLVICYYWYSGMIGRQFFGEHDEVPSAESVGAFDMGIMLVPVEVGGRIWAVVGYFSPLDDQRDKSYTVNERLNSSSWDFNFHIYNDIHDRLKKDLRHSVIDLYNKMHAHFYAHISSTEFVADLRKQNDKAGFIERYLNFHFAALGAYLPTDVLNVKIQEGLAGPMLRADEGSAPVVDKGVLPPGLSWLLGQPVKPGAYLTHELSCATKFFINPFFPSPLGSTHNDETAGRHLKLQDLQMAMSFSLAYSFVRRAQEGRELVERAIHRGGAGLADST